MIRIEKTLIDDIRRHAEAAYPHECCGALLGRVDGDRKDVAAVERVDNRRDGDDARRRYLIGADDYRRIDRDARARGFDVLGFYHSHPDHPARPSETDRAEALPWYSYLIVSVENGRSADLTSWVLADDRAAFSAEEVA